MEKVTVEQILKIQLFARCELAIIICSLFLSISLMYICACLH